jgi:hypothetical protein
MVEPMNQTTNKRILTSRQEILDYTGISKHLYLKFIRAGMPVLYIEGRCYAHTDNIDEFFRLITKSNAQNLPEDTILGDDEPFQASSNHRHLP